MALLLFHEFYAQTLGAAPPVDSAGGAWHCLVTHG
jgi:hypothetical protein